MARGQARHRPAHRRRLLLRFRPRPQVHRRRPRDDRGYDEGGREGEPEVRTLRVLARGGREDHHRAQPDRVQARSPRRHPRGRTNLVLQERRVHGPLRRHARALLVAGEGVQAPLHRRRVPPRRLGEQADAAHLRHRLRLARRTGAAPATSRRSEAPRPPQGRQGPASFPHRRGCRARPHPVDAQRRDHPSGAAELHLRRVVQSRLQAGVHAAHRQTLAVQDLRPLPLLQGVAVLARRRPRPARRSRQRGRFLRRHDGPHRGRSRTPSARP